MVLEFLKPNFKKPKTSSRSVWDLASEFNAKYELAKLHIAKGNEYANNGDYGKSVEEYVKAASHLSGHPGVHVIIGIGHLRMGNLDSAIEHFNYALLINGNHPIALHGKSIAHLEYAKRAFEEGDYSIALEHLDKAKSANAKFLISTSS